MLGLARPTAGSIRLRGCVVPDDIYGALSRVGGIVEEPRFYPYLSGRRNLDVWAAHHGDEARARIPAMLERVALSERADDKVKTYSLGMRQRLGVAPQVGERVAAIGVGGGVVRLERDRALEGRQRVPGSIESVEG